MNNMKNIINHSIFLNFKNFIFRLNDLRRGVFRRGSTSNATGSDLEYDPTVINRRFSIQVGSDQVDSRRLHTSQAHLGFDKLEQNDEL